MIAEFLHISISFKTVVLPTSQQHLWHTLCVSSMINRSSIHVNSIAILSSVDILYHQIKSMSILESKIISRRLIRTKSSSKPIYKTVICHLSNKINISHAFFRITCFLNTNVNFLFNEIWKKNNLFDHLCSHP